MAARFSIKHRPKLPNNEMFNAVSHAVGGGLGLIGVGALIALCFKPFKPMHLTGFVIYGLTLLGMYSMSTIYHFFCHFENEKARTIFQRLDHGAIYLFIAGSYTPICLTALPEPLKWGMLAGVWLLAAGGILMKIFQKDPDHPLSFVLYLIMGWLAVAAFGPLSKGLTGLGLQLLVGGGIAYTLGAAVYATKWPKLKPGRFGSHELWHLFVLTGSMLHFGLMVTLVA